MTGTKSSDDTGRSSLLNPSVQQYAKRTAILSRAARLFNCNGFRATTLRDVARPQGFNREEQNRLKQAALFKTGTRFFIKQGFTGASRNEIAEHLLHKCIYGQQAVAQSV